MKYKVFKGSDKKLDKIEEYRKHFGWETTSREYRRLVMSYDKHKKNRYTLRYLEKQANTINSKFPKKMIIWTILAALFLVPYFFLKDGVLFNSIDLNEILGGVFSGDFSWLKSTVINLLPILLLILGALNAFFAIYQFIVFWVIKIPRKRMLEEIYRVADALSGNIIDAPLKGNIEPDGPNTGEIEKRSDVIGNRK